MPIVQKLRKGLSELIDIRDVFLLGGWAMLGTGLYLWQDTWLSLIVCGPLLMVIGYLMKD